MNRDLRSGFVDFGEIRIRELNRIGTEVLVERYTVKTK